MKKIIIVIVFLLFFVGGIAGYAYYRVNQTVDNIYHPIDEEKEEEYVDTIKKEAISFLLLGIDSDESRPGTGRSDTIIIVTVNRETEKSTMLSVARDTLVYIPDAGINDKINHAYAYGGIGYSIRTVESLFNIPIDYYVTINMDGFVDFVNAVGGVEIDNTFLEFEYGGSYFPLGRQHLNGEDALNFTRMRYDDPEGEFGRQARQRAIIQQLVAELMTFRISRYNDILKAVENNVTTNINLSDGVSVLKKYNRALRNVEELKLAGEGQMIDRVWYNVVTDEQIAQMSAKLRRELLLEEATYDNEDPYLEEASY